MLSSDSAAQPVAVQTQPERLDSWKQIAAYLGRDIRTVQRWEKLEGLPVHRHQHQKRASAFAYTPLPVLLMLARSGANHEHPVQRLAMIAPLDTKIGVHPVISPEGKKV